MHATITSVHTPHALHAWRRSGHIMGLTIAHTSPHARNVPSHACWPMRAHANIPNTHVFGTILVSSARADVAPLLDINHPCHLPQHTACLVMPKKRAFTSAAWIPGSQVRACLHEHPSGLQCSCECQLWCHPRTSIPPALQTPTTQATHRRHSMPTFQHHPLATGGIGTCLDKTLFRASEIP